MILWVALAIVILITLAVVTRPAFQQKNNEVVVRQPGSRWLGPRKPAQPFASEDFPYAFLSSSAYCLPAPAVNDPRCADVVTNLGSQRKKWSDFPDSKLQSEMDAVHLRAQVWENRSQGLLVVAFGGTVASNLKDWKANTHCTHPFLKDKYTVLGDAFVRAFAQYLAVKMQQPGGEFLGKTKLIATGHSLGAGLAEKFAYSLPPDEFRVPRVQKVYAFDPTPVTSFLNTAFSIRREN
jgi:hypothetical protein